MARSPDLTQTGTGPRLRFRNLDRVPFEAAVALRFGKSDQAEGRAIDVARNGLAVRGVTARPPGTLVELEVRHQQMVFSGLAVVVWAKGQAMGLEFRYVERAGRALIAEILERGAAPAAD